MSNQPYYTIHLSGKVQFIKHWDRQDFIDTHKRSGWEDFYLKDEDNYVLLYGSNLAMMRIYPVNHYDSFMVYRYYLMDSSKNYGFWSKGA